MSNSIMFCRECQDHSHWIELRLVNEHAKPFADKLNGVIKTKDGAVRKVTLKQGYFFEENLPSGPVQLVIPTDELLKAAYPHPPRLIRILLVRKKKKIRFPLLQSKKKGMKINRGNMKISRWVIFGIKRRNTPSQNAINRAPPVEN